ncbi:MAG: ABC transporter substrate-binding protein [Streptosporangiaceae bacterium]
MRPAVKFSDGKPKTSADVKFSIEQNIKATKGWAYIDTAIQSIDTPTPGTVVIHLKFAWAPLIADLSLFANGIVPDNYGGQTEDQFYQHPIGTGPFMWDFWHKGQALKLVRNPHYWQPGLPYLNSVTWTDVPSDNTRELQLKGGHVRRAISLAIDRDALVKAVLFGNGKPANSLFPPQVPYYDPATPGYQLNLAQAKQEMAQSSVPGGFTTTILIASGDSDYATIATILQSELKPLGITVKVQQLDPNTANTDQQSLKYDMTLTLWTMDIPDPDELATFAVDPASGAQSFFTAYDNPTVVKDTHAAEQTTTPATRQSLYNIIQTDAAQDAFMAYLYYSPYPYATSTSVHGFYVTPLGNYQLQNVWISK